MQSAKNRIILLLVIISYSTLLTAQNKESPSFSFKEISSAKPTPDVIAQQYKASDNTALTYYHFATEKVAKATVVVIHGGGAHSKLGYTFLAQTLKDSFQIETYLLDLRGHGVSEGRRGDSRRVKAVWDDVKLLIQMIKSKSESPIYLAGHSSGAGLILNYASWKKKEPVTGYFFISPELGYKSNTEKEDRIAFAKVKIGKFVVNSMSAGLLYANSYAVFFNYPAKVLTEQPLLVDKITVNMSKALTPQKPVKQMRNIAEPLGLFVGENDELFDTEKVLEYGKLSANKKTIYKLIANKNHLSILLDIGFEIGHSIEEWQKN